MNRDLNLRLVSGWKKRQKETGKMDKKRVKKDLKLRLLAPQQLPPGSHCCLQIVGHLHIVAISIFTSVSSFNPLVIVVVIDMVTVIVIIISSVFKSI